MIKKQTLSTQFVMEQLSSPFTHFRMLRHVTFWLAYYLFFSLIWMKPELGYFSSFYLEFILMPIRIMAAYSMMYWLIPAYLVTRKYRQFVLGYFMLIGLAGGLQSVFDLLFYQQLLLNNDNSFIGAADIFRSIVLVNTTVMLAMTFMVFKLFLNEQEHTAELKEKCHQLEMSDKPLITLKSNRRIYHIAIDHIQYIQGMGNYVNYFIEGHEKLVVYCSIKACLEQLPTNFIRLNRSTIINLNQVQSYNSEDVIVAGVTLTRGKNITDEDLAPSHLENEKQK